MPHRTLIAIPIFNEERYVESVLDEVRRYADEILVVDDGSTDETPTLLRRREDIHLVTHAENRGYGKSIADAFCFAQRHGYDWLVTMDCDEQHEPSYIPRFIEAAYSGGADVISGTRYPAGHVADPSVPSDRREINRVITERLNSLFRLGITDAFCGFKAYRVSSLKCVRITVPGYAMPMQWWVQVWRAGLRVEELAVRLIYKDPTRHFGGHLDDPAVRLDHYLAVLSAELRNPAILPSSGVSFLPCR
ncbi:MAG: glycosyltransferase family 2 protein [Phycisphaerae bacterium]|nr:glycosyltransferase family 2 protein [Phycisphaerae bacterium]